jgi:hypothetical protein
LSRTTKYIGISIAAGSDAAGSARVYTGLSQTPKASLILARDTAVVSAQSSISLLVSVSCLSLDLLDCSTPISHPYLALLFYKQPSQTRCMPFMPVRQDAYHLRQSYKKHVICASQTRFMPFMPRCDPYIPQLSSQGMSPTFMFIMIVKKDNDSLGKPLISAFESLNQDLRFFS